MENVHSIDVEEDQFAYRYDTQLLIDRRDEDLDEDEIAEYISEHFEGNCLIAVGDEDLIKIHFHTNEPWKILEYCNSIGEIYDIVVGRYDPAVSGTERIACTSYRFILTKERTGKSSCIWNRLHERQAMRR